MFILKINDRESFTLIELIVVIAIIAILAAIIAPNAFRAIEKAKISRAISDLKAIKQASGTLYADTGIWPVSEFITYIPVHESALVLSPGQTSYSGDNNMRGWDGPYLEKSNVMHPWAGQYILETGELVWIDGQRDTWLEVEIEDSCYPSGPNGQCPVPLNAGEKIDYYLDDGDLSAGQFRRDGGSLEYLWMMQEGVCTNPGQY